MDPSIAQLIFRDREIAYAITDAALDVVEVSGAVGVLGEEGRNWLGRSLLDLAPELAGSEEALADILAGDLPRLQLSWINRETAGGQTMYLTMVALPYRDRKGQITGLVHLVQDATETGRLEHQLTQQRNELRLLQDQLTQQNLELAAANAELRYLDELKSQLISVAAHELRRPLSPIVGYIELLLDEHSGPLNDEQREYLEIMQRGARRLGNITDNLLDVTRLEIGQINLTLQARDLPGLVENVAAEWEPQVESKAQRLTLRASPGLPRALVDEVRAAQIVSNLLSNASNYTSEGGMITVSVTPAQEEGFLQVAVADNGVGISLEDQDKLFRPFFRPGSARLTRASGAGLGLYITRSLVELHGGRIWLESELDKGSTFYVTFPVADAPEGKSEPS
jgi:signal transduction histidine kinase